MGISGPQVIISKPQGIKRSRDVRRLADGEGWEKPFVDSCTSTFKSYLIPSDEPPAFEIPVVPRPAAEVPQFSEGGAPTRRMMLRPADFLAHGYTDGCMEFGLHISSFFHCPSKHQVWSIPIDRRDS